MTAEAWEKVILLIAGGVVAIASAWLNDVRSERRRKNAKREEGYLNWLNTQSAVLGRLKKLAKMAEPEPESVEAYKNLLDQLQGLNSELQNLNSGLNMAYFYERNAEKRRFVELKSTLYAQLIEMLSIVISHQKTHLRFHDMICDAGALVSLLKGKEASASSSEDAKKLGEDRQQAERIHADASNHLSGCSEKLSTDARRISEQVAEIEKRSPELRRLLAG